jgi:hypothetical protein
MPLRSQHQPFRSSNATSIHRDGELLGTISICGQKRTGIADFMANYDPYKNEAMNVFLTDGIHGLIEMAHRLLGFKNGRSAIRSSCAWFGEAIWVNRTIRRKTCMA